MRLALTILACVAALDGGPALADDECFVPMADWKPREAVAALAAQHAWTVRRIKIDDGCYEIDGTDAQGQRIEVTIHPSTLEIIQIEPRDGADHRHRDEEGRHDDQ
ncbi:MAG: PepSY domain-containing protein [Mesorhizobium sp.]|uniref:PepSY domain-containing protein n=1 Tax=Mesorhizobium sp. TaxID=1871066 RepID=UPI001226F7A1|nr:PepSY domain-containing protein [Mesorhizobium sp.]TIO75055.1 MAG: PepSY domain-containing protein [Mesorhizobium sp.]TIO87480.1 MAG: PepSY domain-containing protein [Mesorhizobium sp.]